MTKTDQNKDVGWMYYTPDEKSSTEAVNYPPASQIPGLGGPGEEPPQEERKVWIKESDSPYIKLAKQGGRQDLLAFRENEPKSQPRGYPRCDWFYQDDTQAEEKDDAPYVFMLPEYMVQKQLTKTSLDNSGGGSGRGVGVYNYAPNRLPYATDTTTVYERDDHCTDKTVPIPNDRRIGYGVRAEKAEKAKDTPRKQNTQPPPPKQKSRRPGGPDLGGEEGPTNMHKLMDGTYEREWFERRAEWDAKHVDKSQGGGAKLSTEYKEAYQKMVAEKARNAAAHGGGKQRGDEDPKQARQVDREIEKMEKELFKLSRFKNVNSKVDTNLHHRASDSQRCLYEPSQSDAPKRKKVVYT